MREPVREMDPEPRRTPPLEVLRALAVLLLVAALAAGGHAAARALTGEPALVLNPELGPRPAVEPDRSLELDRLPEADTINNRDTPEGSDPSAGLGGSDRTGSGTAPDPVQDAGPSSREPDRDPGPGAIEADLADREIGLETAAALHERSMRPGSGVWFLDARRAEAHGEARIAGALSMPSARLSGGDGVFALLDAGAEPGDLFVIYCTGGDCEASLFTAEMLEVAGYRNSVVMEAGFDAWAEAGLPVERGPGEPGERAP